MNIIYQTILREPRFNRTWRHARPAVITALGKLAKATGDKAIEAQTNKLTDAEPDEHKKQLASWRQRSPERHGSSQTVPDRIMSGYAIRANHQLLSAAFLVRAVSSKTRIRVRRYAASINS